MGQDKSSEDFVVFNSWKRDNQGESKSFPDMLIEQDKNTEFSNKLIDEIINFLQRAASNLRALTHKDFYKIDDLSWSAHLLENALYNIRILSYLTKDNASNTSEVIAEKLSISPISVVNTDDYIKLDFPIIMRKRKPGTKTTYYDLSLKESMSGVPIPPQYTSQNITMVFLHCYKKEHVDLVRKDHDNIDLKWMIDALNNYFFIDDGPFRTCLFQNSIIDDTDHTVIYLVPTSHLGEFLIKKIPEWEQKRAVENSSKLSHSSPSQR